MTTIPPIAEWHISSGRKFACRLLPVVLSLMLAGGQGLGVSSEPDRERPDASSDGLERVESNGKIGFFDKSGKTVIEPIYDLAEDFSYGLAAVNLGAERDPHFPAKRGGKWGYIDLSGKCVIPPRFNEAHPFVKGIARVHEGGQLRQESFHAPPEWEGGQWKGIDKTGEDAARFFTADAEKAKAALLDLIRNHRDLFVGGPDPDRMKTFPLRSHDLQEPQQFYWAGFVIDVKQRSYHADIVREGYGAWFYSGTFEIDASGQWTANKPEVMEAWFPPHQ